MKHVSLLALSALIALCQGCALREGSHPPIHISHPNTQARLNNVSLLDDSIAKKIAVQGSGAKRTPTGTLEVWTQLRNRTDYPLQVEGRVQFYDTGQAPVEGPTAWQRIHLQPNSITTYKEMSTKVHEPAYYFIEIREGR